MAADRARSVGRGESGAATATDNVLTHQQAERLQFIEDKLFWVGSICNADIRQRFNVSKAGAAQDIARYRERQSASILYEPRGQYFTATDDIAPLFAPQSFDRFVMRVLPSLDYDNGFDATTLVPLPRPVSVEITRPVISAIAQGMEVEIEYVSMKSAPSRRWIAPHALASDGLRYHVRAYDHAKQRFADFVLGRIQQVTGRRKRTADVDNDDAWFDILSLELVPNPKLSPDSQNAIRREYGFDGEVLRHPVRRAMLMYLNTRMMLHSEMAEIPNEKFYRPLVPVDQAEFDRIYAAVRAEDSSPPSAGPETADSLTLRAIMAEKGGYLTEEESDSFFDAAERRLLAVRQPSRGD